MNNIGKIKNYNISKNIINLIFEKGTGFLQIINENIIRVYCDPKNEGSHSKAIEKIFDDFNDFTSKQKDGKIIIKTKNITAIVESDFYVDFFDQNGKSIVKDYRKPLAQTEQLRQEQAEILIGEGHSVQDSNTQELYIAKELEPYECFYGLGDKTGFLNKRHYDYIMWNTDDPSPQVDSYRALYKSIPFYISLKKDTVYGIFFDNTFKTYFDMGKNSDEYCMFGANNGAIDYYFIYGKNMKDIIGGYTLLTGTTPLPQLWTLGYQQSRWGYIDEKDIGYIADSMREHKIPCDVIHMDIDYMDGYRVFTWDKERHPNPKEELEKLAKQGIKIVTIIDPGIKKDKGYSIYDEGLKNRYFATDKDGVTYVNAVWPGDSVYPDFGNSDVRKWWGKNHKALLDMGVQGIWNDMNEPASFNGPLPDDVVFRDEDRYTTHKEIHNVYGHNMAKATYEYLKEETGKRPFVITRACYSGSQKYSTAWTGDNHSIWAHLQMAIPQLCNLGLSGMSFVGTDVGGFSYDPTPELMARWVQVGCFSPLFRNHSALGTKYQEPWKFKKEIIDIYRKYVNLRYSLLPYIYDLFYIGEKTGLPVIRAMVLEYENDINAQNCNDQFMLGENILVSPVVMQGATHKTVYLPEGNWYDFWTNEKITGNKHFTYRAPLDVCPIFVKEGTILPMYEQMEYVGEKALDTLILNIYGNTAKYTHYQDNYTDFNYRNGEYNIYDFKYEHNSFVYTVKHNGYENKYKKFIVCNKSKTHENCEIIII